jgi:hypothetical protein
LCVSESKPVIATEKKEGVGVILGYSLKKNEEHLRLGKQDV